MPSILLQVLIIALASGVHSLYFLMQGSERRCFIEELPQSTKLVGTYSVEKYNTKTKKYSVHQDVKLQITVLEVKKDKKENVVVNQQGQHSGRFTFTAGESAEHRACLEVTSAKSWFNSSKAKVNLDIILSDASYNNKARDVISKVESDVWDLNHRLMEIRREQQYLREREAEFRDLSETINARVVTWTIVQMVVLGLTCVWQMRHLKGFFTAKKLV